MDFHVFLSDDSASLALSLGVYLPKANSVFHRVSGRRLNPVGPHENGEEIGAVQQVNPPYLIYSVHCAGYRETRSCSAGLWRL